MELTVLSTDFKTVAQVDVFETLIWTERYSDYGEFELHTAVDRDLLAIFHEGYYLWTKESDRLMIVEGVQINTDVDEGDRLIVSGRSIESILDRRIVWRQTTLNGSLQDGVKKLINDAVMNPSAPERKIANVVFEDSVDPAITNLTLEGQFNGDNLFDVIKTICESCEIGFKFVVDDSYNFVFSLYAGVDRSWNQTSNKYVIFSPKYDNFSNSSYVESNKALKTTALVVGEGEEPNRKNTTVTANGGGTGLSRREIYVDAGNLSSKREDESQMTDGEYTEQLRQKGLEGLVEAIFISSFEGQADPNGQFAYGVDYSIGDIVQVENEYGVSNRSRILELVRSQDASGYAQYPTFNSINDEEAL